MFEYFSTVFSNILFISSVAFGGVCPKNFKVKCILPGLDHLTLSFLLIIVVWSILLSDTISFGKVTDINVLNNLSFISIILILTYLMQFDYLIIYSPCDHLQ